MAFWRQWRRCARWPARRSTCAAPCPSASSVRSRSRFRARKRTATRRNKRNKRRALPLGFLGAVPSRTRGACPETRRIAPQQAASWWPCCGLLRCGRCGLLRRCSPPPGLLGSRRSEPHLRPRFVRPFESKAAAALKAPIFRNHPQ